MALIVGDTALSLVATIETSLPMTSTAFNPQWKAPLSSRTKPSGLMPTHTSWSSMPFAGKTTSSPMQIFSSFTYPENTLIGGVPRNLATKRLAGES